jgi:hypothetical protein
MPAIEVTRRARDELHQLIETRQLPADTREHVSRSLLTLEEFPRARQAALRRLAGLSSADRSVGLADTTPERPMPRSLALKRRSGRGSGTEGTPSM